MQDTSLLRCIVNWSFSVSSVYVGHSPNRGNLHINFLYETPASCESLAASVLLAGVCTISRCGVEGKGVGGGVLESDCYVLRSRILLYPYLFD